MKTILKCDILSARELEDCIRATKKYTKGALSRVQQHPIQGAEFPSKVLTEYYEVYPEMELSWDMKAVDAWAWVWGDVTRIDMAFLYDYRDNKARVTIHGGAKAVKALSRGIPGFKDAFHTVESRCNGTTVQEAAATPPKPVPVTR